MSAAPLRILFVTNNVWRRDLGAPRVPLELGEALMGEGHNVSKFSHEDAFPGSPPGGSLGSLATFYRSSLFFAARARAHIRREKERWDVIDANHSDLPYPKRELGFDGLLVSRSVALIPAYLDFNIMEAKRWRRRAGIKDRVRDALAYPGFRRRIMDVLPSFRGADLINVSNSDDLVRVRDTMGFGSKVVHFPFGLSDARRAALERAQRSPAERLAARTVAFVGAWNNRKGAADWAGIAPRVLAAVPSARFRFLGTGFAKAHVCRGFDARSAAATEVVPLFRNEQLPELLGAATAGAFPGYLEGFGFGVLEMLGSGLPTLAYDAPGPRDMLRLHAFPSLVPIGDVAAFAAGLIRLLESSPEEHGRWSKASRDVAARFSWEDVARRTARLYAERLEALRHARRASGVG